MDPIITLEIVMILPMLIVRMILIDIQQLEHELVIPMDIINLLIAVTLHIEYDVELEQLPRSYFHNYGSSSQSS